MPRIRRSFFLACLTIVIAAAVALTLFHRQVSLNALVHIAEVDNEVLAYDTLRVLSPALPEYLAGSAELQSARQNEPFPGALGASIARILEGKDIREINVYDRAGKVVFTSDPRERVGNDHAGDPGVRAALAGKVENEFLYRDAFSQLGLDFAYDNLVHSYIPIAPPGGTRIVGVFHLYSDVNDIVHVLERTELRVMLGGLIGFSLLAAALFAVFVRAGDVIESAQLAVEHDKRNLSNASLRVLHTEETSREKIATDLLDGAVQSLSAATFAIESAIARAAAGKLAADDPQLGSTVPVIKEVILELSLLAARLHPASMEELGLLPAFSRVCDEFQRAHPSIQVDSAIQVADEQVPRHLKITIYRTLQAILEFVARHRLSDRVRASLSAGQRGLQLRVDLGRAQTKANPPPSAAAPMDAQEGMQQVRERILLSGGSFSIHADGSGDDALLATWSPESEQAAAPG